MTYPAEHFHITNALYREGRFLLMGEPAFTVLKEHEDFYREFFRASFRLTLTITAEYALLKSSKDQDALARSICIYLAIFCYELDKEGGTNLLEQLAFETFSIADWEERFEQSSFLNVLEATPKLKSGEQRGKFYQEIARRGLIERSGDDRFRFTPAHRYFLEFARGVNLRARVEDVNGG